MKIRNGFVSNSSSSSFIVGIAKVKEGAKDVIDLNFPDDINFITVKELREKDSCWGIYLSGDNACYDSFMWDTVRINISEMKDEDVITFFSYHYGDEEDYCDEDGYCNYDNEVEDSTADSIYEVFRNGKLLEGVDIICGAGRNG